MRNIVFIFSIAFAALGLSAGTLVFECSYSSVCSSQRACDEANFTLEFNVDTVSGQAFMIGNNGLSEVTAIRGSSGVTFLEGLESCAVQTTTYSDDGKSVHSRHTIIGANWHHHSITDFAG